LLLLTVFGPIALAHVSRIAEESSRLITEPNDVALTVAAAGLSGWAWRLLLKSKRV
jgi:hypothetical protein